SAAFLAASVIAAPAFATEPAKTTTKTTTTAPVIKADQTQTKSSTSAVKPAAKSDVKSDVKADKKADATTKAMNANAAMTPSGHHKSVRSHRHHHKAIAAKTTVKKQPDLSKPAAPAMPEKRS